ncbi:MAG: pilV [Rhodocyclaceae bacterium]|nr:pilV [Rhodocyclaceae bacterium]
MKRTKSNQSQQGVTLIEVLVAILIAAVGLLGLAGLQARAMTAEFESYQRSQALLLAMDMAERMRMNRAYFGIYKNVSNADDGTGFVGTAGTGHFSLSCPSADHATQSLCDWDDLLKGSAEKSGAAKIGAMIGARGCVTYAPSTELAGIPDSGEFTVAVVWQGNAETAAPTVQGTGVALNCARNLYTDSDGTVKEGLRRGVAFKFRYARLK